MWRERQSFPPIHIDGAISVDMVDNVVKQRFIATLSSGYPTFTYFINSGRGVSIYSVKC
jgi:hypothetical protein